MVLSVIEENNSVIFIFEASRWLTFIIRWVDDIWIAVVCILSKDLSESGMDRCKLSASEKCKQRIEMIKNAYKNQRVRSEK